MQDILMPVSPGELLDRITILRIKAGRIVDVVKLANVRHELALLEGIWESAAGRDADLADEIAALRRVNERLRDTEDRIREHERTRTFDAGFIDLARSVYIDNDERARIKRRINLRLGSAIVEEKSYSEYR